MRIIKFALLAAFKVFAAMMAGIRSAHPAIEIDFFTTKDTVHIRSSSFNDKTRF
jgi:hypothetical protein